MTSVFLFFGLLFPRITLLWCYLVAGLPINSTPFAADVLGAFFAPRLLIAFWAYESNQHPIWIILYIVFWLVAVFTPRAVSSNKDK